MKLIWFGHSAFRIRGLLLYESNYKKEPQLLPDASGAGLALARRATSRWPWPRSSRTFRHGSHPPAAEKYTQHRGVAMGKSCGSFL
jgi:hypothetical protein